jgi:hypothetical protein
MKRTLWILGLAICMMAVFTVTGCDKAESPVSPPNDEVVVDQPGEDGILTAEQINAIGREQHKEFLANGGKLPEGDGEKGMCISLHVPFYSQRDGNWGGVNLGHSHLKIRDYGCHLTCISMLYAKWGHGDMNPKVLNTWAKSHSGFSGPNIIPRKAVDRYENRNTRNISPNQIYGELVAGRPVIVRTTYGGSHFMIIYGFDGYRFWVKDPLKDWRHQSVPLYGHAHNDRPFRVYY